MAKDKDTKIDGGFRDHQCGEAAAEKPAEKPADKPAEEVAE